jgi:cyclic nucleotide gated channel alpha 3
MPLELLVIRLIGYRVGFRLNRLIRINRFFECRTKTETRTSYPFLFRIVYLVLLIMILTHWNACFYFLISKYIGVSNNSWVFSYTQDNAMSKWFTYEYISCFFWSTLMLTTIGEVREPTSTLESVVMIVNFLVAIVLIATLVGNIGSGIAYMNLEKSRFKQNVDAIKSFMGLRKVSKELDKRTIKWFDYLQQSKQRLDEYDILSALPEKLRTEIISKMYLSRLRNVDLLADCEEGLLRELVCKLRLQVYSPGDYIYRKDDIGKEMYIVKKGYLHVVDEKSQTIYLTLKENSHFGEASILNIPGQKIANRRTSSVKSIGYSELLRLSKEDIWETLTDYTENRLMLIEKSIRMLESNRIIDANTARKYLRKYSVLTESNSVNKVKCAQDQIENEEEHRMINSQSVDVDLNFQYQLTDYSSTEQKLESLENICESLEKRIDTIIEQFKSSSELVKEKLITVKHKYDRKIGITV